MKNITQTFLAALLLLAVGCSSTRTPAGLPPGAYAVGGGARISFDPPEKGTCILVEKSSGKVIATKSSAGGGFEFDAASEQDQQLLQAAYGGMVPTNAVFVLYFVPERTKP